MFSTGAGKPRQAAGSPGRGSPEGGPPRGWQAGTPPAIGRHRPKRRSDTPPATGHPQQPASTWTITMVPITAAPVQSTHPDRPDGVPAKDRRHRRMPPIHAQNDGQVTVKRSSRASARAAATLCLQVRVELRGLEPLASCMPFLPVPYGIVTPNQDTAGHGRARVRTQPSPTGAL